MVMIMCVSQSADGQESKGASFQIPPTGQPEQLVGQIDFDAPSALAFDSRNRPYMFDTREPAAWGYMETLRDGKWVRRSYEQACRKAVPGLVRPTERFIHAYGTVTIDEKDNLYAVVPVYVDGEDGQDRKWVLLTSTDLGETFEARLMEGYTFLEIDTGHNNLSQPPLIGMLVRNKPHPARWTNYNDLYVFVPRVRDGNIVLGEPLHVTADCFGISNHSGGYSFAATTGRLAHVVYGQIPSQDETGNPTYVATIDRQQRQVLRKTLLAHAHPKHPDVHSTPVITADSEGCLHVLAGAHGGPFLYTRSLTPDAADGKWTEPRKMHDKQTYASLVCDDQNRLHSVYRIHPNLLYQHKPARAADWSEPRILADPPPGHTGYSVYYHRLFIDRRDALYLSFTFYDMQTKEQGIYPRALAVSLNRGKTWRLATTDTLAERVAARAAGSRPAAPATRPAAEHDGGINE